MLKTQEEVVEKEGVGIIVGRFHVSALTKGHTDLFDSVIARHQKVLCIIGLAPIKATKINPLDFEARRRMIAEQYPDMIIFYIKDQPDDTTWSRNLDDIISDNIPPASNATLYGSRDSCLSYYSGRYNTKELLQQSYVSGTKDRSNISYEAGNSEDFRKGVIWATQNQYDTAFCTVDIAIINKDVIEGGPQLLLGRKENEKKFRFIGGFIDPRKTENSRNNRRDDVFQHNARREVYEETGYNMEIGTIQHIGSYLMDDWRYRSEKSKIITSFYFAYYEQGRPEPTDDIYELKWFSLREFVCDKYVKENLEVVHYELMQELIKRAKIEKLFK